MKVEIYTDGACRGNPGPGGWGALLRYQGHEKFLSGAETHTTNNRMELTAVIRALELITPVAQGSPGPRNLWRTRMPDTLIARVEPAGKGLGPDALIVTWDIVLTRG